MYIEEPVVYSASTHTPLPLPLPPPIHVHIRSVWDPQTPGLLKIRLDIYLNNKMVIPISTERMVIFYIHYEYLITRLFNIDA